jgi:putative flippase GtrA
MSALSARVRAYRQSPHFNRILKFGMVSVISTIVAQSILFVMFDRYSLASAMACNVVATAVATVPAYWLNRTWTWGKRGKSSFWREVMPFWILAFIGLVLSTVAVGVAAHNVDLISHKKLVKDLVVHFANFTTYGLIWVARYAIFNKFMFGPGTPHKDAIDTVAVEKSAHGEPAVATPEALLEPVNSTELG